MIAAAPTLPAAKVIGPKPVRASSTPRKLAPQMTPSVKSISQFKTCPEGEPVVVFDDNIFAKLILQRAKVKDNAVFNFGDLWSEGVRLSIKSYYGPNKVKGGQETNDKVDLI